MSKVTHRAEDFEVWNQPNPVFVHDAYWCEFCPYCASDPPAEHPETDR